jgi:hypothetical protein
MVLMKAVFQKDEVSQDGNKGMFRISADNDSHHSAFQTLREEVSRNGDPPRSGLDDRIVALWHEMMSVLTSHEVNEFEAFSVADSWTEFKLG